MFYPFKSKAQPQRPGTSRSRRMPSGCGCGGREGPRALRSVCLSAQGQRLGWRRGTHVCQLHRALGLLPQPPPEGSCAVVNRARPPVRRLGCPPGPASRYLAPLGPWAPGWTVRLSLASGSSSVTRGGSASQDVCTHQTAPWNY